MKIIYSDGGARITGAPLDLKLTLVDSAQSFGWTVRDDAFYGFAAGIPVRARQENAGIFMFPCAESQIEHFVRYFDLARDYVALAANCAGIPSAVRAFELLSGLRVLNQDPWEAVFAFILSANNNTARINSLVVNLSRAYGQSAEIDGVRFYDVPTPAALIEAGENALRTLGCGYRAPYLIRTAEKVLSGFPLYELKDMTYEEAHERLKELPGVGDKVADCILLFGCGHTGAFPVDIWVDRLLRAWFPEVCGPKASRAKIGAAARAHFGKDAGLIQQYLFHCARLGLIELTEEWQERAGS